MVMAAAGSLFTFSVFSDSLRSRFDFTSSDVNLISGVGNTALYLSFLAIGPIYDRCGSQVTMAVALASYTLGYALMWAAFQGSIGGQNVVAISFYYFLAGFGSTAGYMATIGVNIVNFPPHLTGLTTGILLLFYGLSGTIYSQIYSGFYPEDTGGFLLFLMLSVAIVNGIGCFTIYPASTPFYPSKPNSNVVGESLPQPTERSRLITAESPLRREVELDEMRLPLVQDQHSRTDSESRQSSNQQQSSDTSVAPLDILKSKYFWLYAMVCIWQQGLTYMSNVSTILAAINPPDTSPDWLAKIGALHVTLLSIGQSIGRFFAGTLSDWMIARLGYDRSALLIVAQALLIIPHLIVALAASGTLTLLSGTLFYFCSACIGLAFGAAGALFPPITKDLFGTAFYGTACAFVMTGVPIGIIISNLVFGALYDSALASQHAALAYSAIMDFDGLENQR
eukprot:jgi/Hompol1/1369/HPOL_005108-RA